MGVSEFVGEVSDLAVGLGILTFALAPFALPILALTALVAVVLAIPILMVVGGYLALQRQT